MSLLLFLVPGLISFMVLIEICKLPHRFAKIIKVILTILSVSFISMFFMELLYPGLLCSSYFDKIEKLIPAGYMLILASIDYYIFKKSKYFSSVKEFCAKKLTKSSPVSLK